MLEIAAYVALAKKKKKEDDFYNLKIVKFSKHIQVYKIRTLKPRDEY